MQRFVASFLVLVLSHSALASSGRYIVFSSSQVRDCSIKFAKEPVFNICLKGQASETDLIRAKEWAAKATLAWFRVLKVRDDDITRQWAFTCENPHLTFTMRPGNGRSFASPRQVTIYMGVGYGTWTHELGHALAGLSDTYQGSQAGACGSQPDSLMCWGAYGPRKDPVYWSTLWPDDIAGIIKNYSVVFPGTPTAPQWASEIDLEAPVNLLFPWPGSDRIEERDHRVKVLED